MFIFLTLYGSLLEMVASKIMETLKTQWFQSLLKPNMAYNDIAQM
jgi:hypothetical protein